ncbi:RNase H domain-containing protein [Trichonephila clavipes]|nr:RNase H domain-containing protein [Trichonephila clavipes]
MPDVNKMPHYPKLLKQLAVEVIDVVPLDALKIFTDGIGPFSCRPAREREVADYRAKVVKSDPENPEDHMVLTSTEICSRAKELLFRIWIVLPIHVWYFQRHPGSNTSFKDSRSYQTAFLQFSTDHLRYMNSGGSKRCLPICNKCNINPFYLQHIVQYLGFFCE